MPCLFVANAAAGFGGCGIGSDQPAVFADCDLQSICEVTHRAIRVCTVADADIFPWLCIPAFAAKRAHIAALFKKRTAGNLDRGEIRAGFFGPVTIDAELSLTFAFDFCAIFVVGISVLEIEALSAFGIAETAIISAGCISFTDCLAACIFTVLRA